ncbi:MAG: DNA polymerase ligase N-terminal domain-containing protein [bacterium]
MKKTYPAASKNKFSPTGRFVVQEHHATQLHYDFRLESEGVLKSWAVPKGLPVQPALKRLAISVEDHPIDYISFEGIIPQGSYGAGRVIIWDSGTYTLLDKKSGRYVIMVKGSKLKGRYVLIKIGPKNWLIFKS